MAAALAPLVLLSLRDCSNALSCSDSSTWWVDITIEASGCGDGWGGIGSPDWVIRGQTGDSSSWCCDHSSDADYYGYATVKFCPDVTVGTINLWIWETDNTGWPSCDNANPPGGWSDSGNDCKSARQITIPRLASGGYSTSWSDEGGTKYIGVSAPKGNMQDPTAYPTLYPTGYPTLYPTGYPTRRTAPTPSAPSFTPTPPAPTKCPSRVPGISPGAVTVDAVSCGAAACRAVQTIPVGEEFELCDPCIYGPITGVTLEVSTYSAAQPAYTLKITDKTIPGRTTSSTKSPVYCGTCIEISGFSAEIPCPSSTGTGRDSGDSGVPVGAIVGGLVGGLVLIGLIVGLVLFVRLRQANMAKATRKDLTTGLSEQKGAEYTEMNAGVSVAD